MTHNYRIDFFADNQWHWDDDDYFYNLTKDEALCEFQLSLERSRNHLMKLRLVQITEVMIAEASPEID